MTWKLGKYKPFVLISLILLLFLGARSYFIQPSAVAEFYGNSSNFYLKVPALGKAFLLRGADGGRI
jgi:hypothetical protein